MGEPQQTLQHFLNMFADKRRSADVDHRGLGHLKRRVLKFTSAQDRVVQFGVHVAMTKLWIIVYPVFRALYRHGAHACCLADLHQSIFVQGLGPGFDVFVQFNLMFEAPGQGR